MLMKKQVPSEHWYIFIRGHGVIFQQVVIFIVTARRQLLYQLALLFIQGVPGGM